MKLFQRGLSVALALLLAVPAFFGGEAEALTTSNYTPEANNSFLQLTGDGVSGADPVSLLGKSFLLSDIGTMDVSDNDNASWAHAAIALLNRVAGKYFDLDNLLTATTRNAGNRSLLTAYLMRGTKAGPTVDTAIRNEKPLEPVSGVVYIPDLRVTDGADAKGRYIDRIKYALSEGNAVAASLYFTDAYLYESTTQGTFVYDNNISVTGTSMARKAPDHTVVILGWDNKLDGVDEDGNSVDGLRYLRPVTTGTGDNATTSFEEETVMGGFLVQDSLGRNDSFMGGDTYWVSYETILSGAYYIEGIHNANSFPIHSQRVDDDKEPVEKNPLALTYEYDLNGQTGQKPISGQTAYYANVFDLKDGAAALHAVSVFLTGEKNQYEVYLIKDYKKSDNLKLGEDGSIPANWELLAEGTKPLPGYYTLPLIPSDDNVDSTALISGKKFAIIVANTSNGNETVPVQVSGTSTKTGQGFYSSDGTTWTDAGTAAICIKAHAEKDVDIELEGITILDADSEEANTSGNPMEVAPGGTYTLGPTMIPATANDILYGLNEWEATMPYFERDENGWLLAVENEAGEWVAATEEADGTLKALEGTPADRALVWHNGYKIFLPDSIKPVVDGKVPQAPSGWKQNLAWNKETGKSVAVSNYIEQPISINNPATNSAPATLKVSSDATYFDTASTTIVLTATVTKGKKANGKFEKISSEYVPNGTETCAISVVIEAEAVAKVILSRTSHTMKAGGTVTLTAKQQDKDEKAVAARKVTWIIANSSSYADGDDTGYAQYNPRDPYNPSGPVALIDSNGKVTALRDGTCYIYAKAGGQTSEPCELTVTQVNATGVSVSKKKYTISSGTMLTMTANVKPSSASNKRVSWTSEDPTIATIIDPIAGIIEAKEAGITKLIATTDDGAYTAECVLTVSDGPSIVKKGKTVTFSVLGAASKDTVVWEFVPTDSTTVEGNTVTSIETGKAVLTGAKNGIKYKVTGKEVGSGKLTAKVMTTVKDENGNDVKIDVREQSWQIHSAVPISKMQFRDQKNEIVKKLTLCVDENGNYGQEQILTVNLVKPANATMLGFSWTAKKDKAGDDIVKIDDDLPATVDGKVNIKVTALKAGSTKITGVNYNGNKKINISIKVLNYPPSGTITVKSTEVNVVPGKKVTMKGKISGKTYSKDLRYSLYDETGMLISGWDPETGAYIKDVAGELAYLEMRKGKQTGKVITRTLPSGTESGMVKLSVRGTPFTDTGNVVADKVDITINLVPKAKRS